MAAPPRRPAAPLPWGAKPSVFDRALAAHQQGRLDEARQLYVQVRPTDARYPIALHHHGLIALSAGHPEEALQLIQQSLRLQPRDIQAQVNLADVLATLGRFLEALAACNGALTADPRHTRAWTIRGNAAWELGQIPLALESYDHALALQPALAEAWANRGTALRALGHLDQALQSYERALALAPSNAALWMDKASVLASQRRFEEALPCFDRASALAPDDPSAAALARTCLEQLALWRDLPQRWRSELEAVGRAGRISQGLSMLTLPGLSARQLADGLRKHLADLGRRIQPAPFGRRSAAQRLRVAYLSPDFRDHAMARLMAGVFEQHDRARFEITAVAFEPLPATDFGQRLARAFDRVIDAKGRSDDEVVAQLRDLQIDLAVDLAGHTSGHRLGIAARRAAPLQVNYLGYPGTTGAPFIDYIIGDRWVTPLADAQDFSEKIVLMPESFQANDDRRLVAPDTPSRAALGLPPSGFVFCCLNNTYKIGPTTFDSWMRLLSQVPDSVLWLLGETPTVVRNLRAEASARGVVPERLVFAQRRPYEEYLAQYRQADLFLDTLPFNAGTTASDALWAGLPVLTQLGQTFAGRMAASLLDAVGLPELIAHSTQEYEELALRLATEPGLLQGLRERLAANRPIAPLFDTARFTRHLEAAYETMWQRHAEGLSPDHIVVPGQASGTRDNTAATG